MTVETMVHTNLGKKPSFILNPLNYETMVLTIGRTGEGDVSIFLDRVVYDSLKLLLSESEWGFRATFQGEE